MATDEILQCVISHSDLGFDDLMRLCCVSKGFRDCIRPLTSKIRVDLESVRTPTGSLRPWLEKMPMLRELQVHGGVLQRRDALAALQACPHLVEVFGPVRYAAAFVIGNRCPRVHAIVTRKDRNTPRDRATPGPCIIEALVLQLERRTIVSAFPLLMRCELLVALEVRTSSWQDLDRVVPMCPRLRVLVCPKGVFRVLTEAPMLEHLECDTIERFVGGCPSLVSLILGMRPSPVAFAVMAPRVQSLVYESNKDVDNLIYFDASLFTLQSVQVTCPHEFVYTPYSHVKFLNVTCDILLMVFIHQIRCSLEELVLDAKYIRLQTSIGETCLSSLKRLTVKNCADHLIGPVAEIVNRSENMEYVTLFWKRAPEHDVYDRIERPCEIERHAGGCDTLLFRS